LGYVLVLGREDTGMDLDAVVTAYEDAGKTPADLAADMKREMALMMIDWDVVEQLFEAAQRAGTVPCFQAVILVAMEELQAAGLLADCANDLAA
jgi:hypothetical protein